MINSKFLTLVTVFFFWGFMAASNGIFIPFCKSHFQLSQFQSQLIDLAFYVAYFVGSLMLYIYQQVARIDLLNHIGYKAGIIYGLIISAVGSLCMIAALHSGSYWLILAAFFVIALGFSLQQTCAQPFAIALGDAATGSQRLNLAGGVNSIGTTIGPLVLGYLLFGSLTNQNPNVEIITVDKVYMFLSVLFLGVAFFLYMADMPRVQQDEPIEPGSGALKYPQLSLGMLAIFVYVGVEVTIQSNLAALLALPEFGGYKTSEIAPFISLYWGSLMIGRLTGATGLFNIRRAWRNAVAVILPFTFFALILGINMLAGHNVNPLLIYFVPITAAVAAIFIGDHKPARTLFVFALFGIVAMCIGMATTGKIAVFAFVSGGLACSIMWPCIFTLAVTGLGKYTAQGSTFLIMMILGGAIIPPFQGWLADIFGIHQSYFITIFLFGYLAFYAIKARQVLQAQGHDFESDDEKLKASL